MGHSSEEELPFIPLDQSDDPHPPTDPAPSRLRRVVFNLVLTLSLACNLLLAGVLVFPKHGATTSSSSQVLYSPAMDAIAHKPVKFTRGFSDDVPLYEQAPSPEVDKAWEDLWHTAPVKIPRAEAARLPNLTWPILGDEENYLTALDMFHQLHCLDMLRQGIDLPSYPSFDVPMNHLRHCVGALRQSIMCFGDISPISWQWNPKRGEAEQRDDIVHSCRDYDRIREWADDHRFKDFNTDDLKVYIETDLSVVEF
ncbi:hypothetical protein OF83DRAFT_1140195 [Amylostereum chailletii]|nr:hypothetical protein OF83DRAFT_1140195 [Amylostereum chailletii]